MKIFKNVLCILLTALLTAATGIIAVHAQEPEQPDMEELHQKFIKYLDEQGVEHKFGDFESSYIEFIAVINGWTVFFGTAGSTEPAYVSERIGDYVFTQSSYCHPYKIGLYAKKDGKIRTLQEAFETGDFLLNQLADMEHYLIQVYSPGDIDLDGAVSVSDIIKVQKVIAKQIEMIEFFDLAFYDFDGNGIVEVKDALDMQKMIAKVTE